MFSGVKAQIPFAVSDTLLACCFLLALLPRGAWEWIDCNNLGQPARLPF
jgi:hypothetical protein